MRPKNAQREAKIDNTIKPVIWKSIKIECSVHSHAIVFCKSRRLTRLTSEPRVQHDQNLRIAEYADEAEEHNIADTECRCRGVDKNVFDDVHERRELRFVLDEKQTVAYQ